MDNTGLKPADVAVRWGVGYQTVLKLISAGKLRAINVSTGGQQVRWAVTREFLEEFEREYGNREVGAWRD